MNNNFKIVKDAFSKISASKELEEKILEMTVRKKENKPLFYRYAMFLAIFFIVSFICFNSFKLMKFNDRNRIHDNEIKEDDKIDNVSDSIEIYMTIQNNQELSWAYDITNSKLVYEKADYVIKVKVLDIGKGTYEYSAKNQNPTTPIKVETLEKLKGDEEKNITQILQWGGIVSVEDVIKNTPETSVNKMGLNKLSDEEKQTKYIKYEESGNFDFEIGKTYIVALIVSKDGNFYIGANGYSIFESNSKDNVYTNVITNNKLEI